MSTDNSNQPKDTVTATATGTTSSSSSSSHHRLIENIINPTQLIPVVPTNGEDDHHQPSQFTPEDNVAEWINRQIKQEVTRLTSLGQKALPLRVFNYGLVTELGTKITDTTNGGTNSESSILPTTLTENNSNSTGKNNKKGKKKKGNNKVPKGRIITNRIEFGTTYNFDAVKQILTSPSIPCQEKSGYRYCHVVLLTSTSPVALIFGYVWDNKLYNDNNLSRWCFINKQGLESYHIVDGYEDITTITTEKDNDEKIVTLSNTLQEQEEEDNE